MSAADSQIEQRIQHVENGLVEVEPTCMAILQASRAWPQKNMALLERMAGYKVPGVSVAVINDHRVEWAKGYGVTAAGSDTPVTTETLFEAASTTKVLAAAIALRMVERGRLDLDEDVNAQLKSWQIPESPFTQDQKVTLRRLLTHQSGLNRPPGGFDLEEGSTPSLVQVLNGQAPARNLAAAVEYVPGSEHQYSNFGYLVVQLLLEDLLGQPYPQIAQEIVFQPLGMVASTLAHPLSADLQAEVALPHDEEGAPHRQAMHPTALAQGGLLTTASDLAQFAVELMLTHQGQSGRLLSPETVQRMFRPELDIDPEQFLGITGQGLGFFTIADGQNLYVLHPGHNDPGATSMLIASPVAGKGAVILANGFNGGRLAVEILAAMVREYGWPMVQYAAN